MLHNALCITTPDFAHRNPLNVFHREGEPWENRHDASLANKPDLTEAQINTLHAAIQ